MQVGSGDDRVDQSQDLATRPMGTRTAAKVNQLVDDRLDLQPLRQRGRQQQPGVGDRMVVEDRTKPCRAVGGWDREPALRLGINGRLTTPILPAQRAFFRIRSRLPPLECGGFRLSEVPAHPDGSSADTAAVTATAVARPLTWMPPIRQHGPPSVGFAGAPCRELLRRVHQPTGAGASCRHPPASSGWLPVGTRACEAGAQTHRPLLLAYGQGPRRRQREAPCPQQGMATCHG